jgi:pSer/pThr/pTyr-binding forkhead associated (FHA) protein
VNNPLNSHASTPRELGERIAAERGGGAFLLYRDGAGEQVIVQLDGMPERITIGRRPSNEIALDWDSEVSRVHAALERAGAEWTVVDDGFSHNGTFVAGERVTARRRLRDGDVIAIGATAIAFCAPSESSTSMATVTSVGPRVAELLTPAQRRVLIALCRPFKDSTYSTPATNQQIADELVVSVDAVKKSIRVGRSRSEDVVYSRGWLWIATPEDNVVTKLNTSNYDQIPISVGQFPRQLAVSRDTAYVTDYNSSDLYMIDAKSSEVIGEPFRVGVNPFSLDISKDDKTLWVGNPPNDRVTEIATGRGG